MSQHHSLNLTWAEIEKTMERLANESLDLSWYRRWSDAAGQFSDLVIGAMWAHDRNVNDVDARDRYRYIQKTLRPRMNTLDQVLVKRSSTFQTNDPHLMRVVEQHKAEVNDFPEKVEQLETEERSLINAYGQLEANALVDFDGETLSLRAANARLRAAEGPDERRELWFKVYEALQDISIEADVIIEELLTLRFDIAREAGFETYLAYVWAKTKRPFDLDTVRQVLEDVANVFGPIQSTLASVQREGQSASDVKPWMLGSSSSATSGISLTESEYQALVTQVFSGLHPSFGACIEEIRSKGYMDLMARPKKSNRNFSTLLFHDNAPLVFTNASGGVEDLRVVLHESGHALHYRFSEKNGHGLFFERVPSREVQELVAYGVQTISITELSKHGHLADPEVKALRRYAATHALQTLMRGNRLERIQHWLYTQPTDKRIRVEQIDEYWMRLNQNMDANWSGLEHLLLKRWQGAHFIRYPLNNITYTIALLGMLLILDRYRNRPDEVISALRDVLRGGSSFDIVATLKHFGVPFPYTTKGITHAGTVLKQEFLFEAS